MKPILPGARLGLGALLFLCGCGPNTEAEGNATGQASPAATALTVVAKQITSAAGAPGTPPARTLTGHFEIRPPLPGEQSVPDATTGGACLVAQVPTTPKSCTADSQCNIPAGSPSTGPGAATHYGYCLGGTCWVKANGAAGAKYCLKGVGAGTHEVPAFHPSEVYAEVGTATPGRAVPVKWKVVGCLNGAWETGKLPPCGGGVGNVMHHEGNVRVVP